MVHSFLYRHWWYFWQYEMLQLRLRHRGNREQQRRVRDAGAFSRTDAGTGRPDRFSSLRADAAAFVRALLRADAAAVLTPFIKAYAAAHKQTESAAHAGAVAQARRPHGRAGPRAFSKAHAGAVATANAAPDAAALYQTVEAPNIQTDAAADARADAGTRRPYRSTSLRTDA